MSGSGTTSPAPPLPVSKLSALHINPAVVQHISYPSDDAVLITQDALQAATQYYELFFQDADELISGASSTNRRAVVEKKSNRTASLNGVEPLSNGPENNTSKNNNNNSEVSSTDDDDDYASSSSCTEADDDANNCDDSAVATASSPLRVNHSPYHTFFPPVLTRRVRLHIIKQIIGHSPRHFSQWGWRKAVEYHALHEKNTQKNTLYEREPGHTSVTIPSGSPAMRFPVNNKASHIYQGLLQHPAASPTSGQGSKPAEDVPSPTGTGGGGDSNIVDDLLATLDGGTYTIPASQQGPEYFSQAAEDGSKTLIIVMVGLPARGKTFLAQKICRLLGWHGTRAKVQNIQVAWRRLLLEWEAAESMMRQNGNSGVSSNNVSTDPGQAPVEKPCTAATKTLPPASEVIRTPAHTSPCTSMLMHTALGPDGCYTPPDGHKALNNHQDVNNNNTNSNGCPNAGTPCVKPACLTAEHFKALITDPHSTARRLYRHVLRSFAEDCRMFFRDGGQVVVINDDFVTEELRDEAEKLFKPLTSQLFYMEVRRDSHLNGKFNECKVKDPIEYPRGAGINQKTAKKDFDERLNVLETYYETLSCASQADAEEELSATYPCSRSDTPPPPPPPKTPADDHNNNNNCPSGSGNKSCGGKKTRSYIKISNAEKIETFGISGYLASRVISYVMNLSQVKIQHPIYFVRHGESGYNLEDRIGGNPFLTPQGMRDAAALLEFINSLKHHLHHIDHVEQNRSQNAKNNNNNSNSNNETEGLNGNSAAAKQASHAGRLEIWTSQLRRAIQTAELSERLLNIKTLRWSSLNEIHAGVCEDMTYAEVRATYPLIETFRKQSKYTFRYPDGESYQDLVVRLEPVIMELENADKVVVVVAHQAVLRCLLAYFGSTSAESSIRVKVPHRTVWRCTYDSKGIASLDELHLDNMEAGFQQVGESAWGKKKNEKA